MDEQEFNYTLNNLWRSRRLIDLTENTEIEKETQNDLLGAAIVFLHATLEEFLRGIAIRQWLKLNDDDLKKVLSKYSRLNTRNIKINLVKSVERRNDVIEKFIQEEIKNFVYQDMNFNSFEEVKDFLKITNIKYNESVQAELKLEEKDYTNIDLLIRKRHGVAHQAECSNLDLEQVLVWAKSLQKLLLNLSQSLGLKIEYREKLKQIVFSVTK
jgi:phosphoribosyl 1,2-cyclic phosphodiesterase